MSAYQDLMRRRSDEKIKTAIDSAKSWWKTDQRFYREAAFVIQQSGLREAICMCFPTPWTGKGYIVREGVLLYRQKEVDLSQDDRKLLQVAYKCVSKNGLTFSLTSDSVCTLCNLNGRNFDWNTDLWRILYGFITVA